MIFHPRVNQRVRVHYARQATAHMPLHGKIGVVRVVVLGRGSGGLIRGPRNVGVEIDGRLFVIPRGNLMALPEKTSTGAAEVEGIGK